MELANLKGVVKAMDEMLWAVTKEKIDTLDARLAAMENGQFEVASELDELTDTIKAVKLSGRTNEDLEQRLRQVERELKEMTERNERLEGRLAQLENQSTTSASAGSWWAASWEKQ